MIFYAIRHKATGQLMPQMKRGRGYSHWNPTAGNRLTEALDIPRLLKSQKQANMCIVQWNALPNAKMTLEPASWWGPGDSYYVDGKSDGRQKSDLEVVKIKCEIKKILSEVDRTAMC